MPDLKPCPFCGGEAVLMLDRESSGWYVLCKGCYSQTDTQIPSPHAPPGRDYDAVVVAIETAEKRWNKRAHDETAQMKAERDAAVKDCGCFPCQTCEERENGDLCRMCEIEGGYRSFHQWRGVQKEGGL